MNRFHNLSSLIISVAVSAMFAPLSADASGDTSAKLNTNTKAVTKPVINSVKTPIAPTINTPQKSAVVKTEIKKTNTPTVKPLAKPQVKPLTAPTINKANVPQKPKTATKPVKATPPTKAQKPKDAEKVKNPKPAVNKETSNNPIPTAAINVWEENARQKCNSWGAKFENIGFSEIEQTNSNNTAIEKIFGNHNNAYITGDFNGDGKKDYVIITPDGGCKTDGNTSFGKIGPPNQFLLSNDKGFSIASGFNAWTGPQQIKHVGNSDIIEITDLYNGKCGQVAKTTWGWDGEKITILERRNPQGQLVNQEGCLILPLTTVNALQMGNSVKKLEFPPIEQGFYSYSVTCSSAISESRRDRPSKFIGLFNSRTWGYFYDDGIAWNNIRLENIELMSENQYRLHLRYLGNANGNDQTEANMKIFGKDRFSITLKGYTTTYSLCPDAIVPDWLKAQFVN